MLHMVYHFRVTINPPTGGALSSSALRPRSPARRSDEVIYLIAKKKFTLAPKASALGDIWKIGQDLKNPHPAPFPVELAERIIRSTTANIILDPFVGSGTTAIAAKKFNRYYIGIDISPEYCRMAEERIRQAG